MNPFPLERLSSELLHLVCTHLEPTENAALRLVCKRMAEIGSSHLVPEAHLIVKGESFARLQALSGHPILARNVHSLFFEADILEVKSFQDWEYQFIDTVTVKHDTPVPCSCIPQVRAQQDRCPWPSEEALTKGFAEYKTCCDDQRSVASSRYWIMRIGKVLGQLPNLKRVEISTVEGIRPYSSGIKKAFPSLLYEMVDLMPQDDAYARGLYQVRSVLLGIYEAGLNIEEFRCGGLGWLLLDLDDDDMAKFKIAMANLRVLGLRLVGEDVDAGYVGAPYTPSWIAERGGLRDFLTSSPHLRELDVDLRSTADIRARDNPSVILEYVVGGFHWPALETVKFAFMDTTEDELMGFCHRHATTLKALRLDQIYLASGSWCSLFENLHRTKQLDRLRFEGDYVDSATEEISLTTRIYRRYEDHDEIEIQGSMKSSVLDKETDWIPAIGGGSRSQKRGHAG